MKFRSKVREIEAEQWFPGKEIPGVYVDDPYRCEGGVQEPDLPLRPLPGLRVRHFVVTIHRQPAYLDPGDWVTPESDGVHFYPIKPDEMAARYDPIEPDGPPAIS